MGAGEFIAIILILTFVIGFFLTLVEYKTNKSMFPGFMMMAIPVAIMVVSSGFVM